MNNNGLNNLILGTNKSQTEVELPPTKIGKKKDLFNENLKEEKRLLSEDRRRLDDERMNLENQKMDLMTEKNQLVIDRQKFIDDRNVELLNSQKPKKTIVKQRHIDYLTSNNTFYNNFIDIIKGEIETLQNSVTEYAMMKNHYKLLIIQKTEFINECNNYLIK